MTQTKKFSEQPLTTRITTIAVCTPAVLLVLATLAFIAGFLWKAVLWAWS